MLHTAEHGAVDNIGLPVRLTVYQVYYRAQCDTDAVVPVVFFAQVHPRFAPGHADTVVLLASLQGNSSASLWIRNIQLGSSSLFLGLLAVVFKDGAEVSSRGFFSGYSAMVWLCISLHSLGGLAVAMVVKYADNVVRLHHVSDHHTTRAISNLDCVSSSGFRVAVR